MAVTIHEARALVIAFCRSYPVAARLTYCLRNTVEELYGSGGKGLTMLGGYTTGPGLHPGRCDIPCGAVRGADDFMASLRHEVIGHWLFMDSGLLTITEGHHRTLWSAAATLPRHRKEPAVLGVTKGSVRWYKPAAALDWARHLSPAQALRPGESAVAAARVEPKCPGSRQTLLVSPIAEVRCGCAALPAHSKRARNP